MKNSVLQKTSILGCVLLICFITNYVMAIDKPQESNKEYLSVQESLLPMLNFAFRMSNEFFPIHRINPDIKEYILFYLEKDNSNREYVAGGIWLLGVVGTRDDIKFVDNYIQSCLNNSNEEEKRLIHFDDVAGAIGCFAGMMLKRDIEGAKQFFQKYANISAWMSSKDADGIDARRGYNYFILGAYQYSKADFILPLLRQTSSGTHPFLQESVIDTLEHLEKDEYTKMMKPGKTPEKTLDKYRRDFLSKNREWIDMLLKKQTLAEWREAYEKQKTVSREQKKPDVSFESVDLSKTVEGIYLKSVASEAAKAYEQISAELIDRDVNDLPIKKEILQDIQKAGLNNYDDFQVMAEVKAKINNFVPELKNGQASAAEPLIVKDKVAASVTFNIKGSAYIYKKYVPNTGDNSLISPTTSDALVNMKRSDEKWYWNSVSEPNVIAATQIIEDKYLIDSVREAVIAYKQIARTITDGNFDPLTIPVLDDGKLIPLKKREKDKDEMAEALELEKRILADLEKAGLNNYIDYRIRITFEASLNDSGVSIKGYETTDVTFMIVDGAGVLKKYAPRGVDYDGPDGSSDLQVYMKRINGKWHWNPFGW
ncbi:MAG: hypothetical protein JW715_17055 [Sedimentisphaerales bacterium]|nr:hypothetical protein [Sedimentisphaerales bacterium]